MAPDRESLEMCSGGGGCRARFVDDYDGLGACWLDRLHRGGPGFGDAAFYIIPLC